MTKDIDVRMAQHFKNGHLSIEDYDEVKSVVYAELQSINEARIYEIYYISLFKPKLNTSIIGDGQVNNIILPELKFRDYSSEKISKMKLTPKKEKVIKPKRLFDLDKLKGERIRRRVTTFEIAEAIGITSNAYYRKESGDINITVEELPIILDTLGIAMNKAGMFY